MQQIRQQHKQDINNYIDSHKNTNMLAEKNNKTD